MVDRGEVDAMLAPETAGECQKFGKVLDCVVFEVCTISKYRCSFANYGT